MAPAVSRHRLTGLACAAAAADALILDGSLDDLARRDREVQVQTLRAERLTLHLCQILADADIAHVVLKGPTLAHRTYPDPATRPFIDVDLLVHGDALERVVQLCEVQGAVRRLPELRPGFDRRFSKSVTLRHPSGVDIDLHRTLALGPLTFLIDVEDLWADVRQVDVLPGRAIPALAPDMSFLTACLQVVVGDVPRWLALRDVVETSGGADLERCRTVVSRWQATALVANAIATVVERGLTIPEALGAWAGTLLPTAREQRVARAYARGGVSARGRARVSVRYVPGALAKAAYVRALLVPSRANRAARHRSLADQARRALGASP